MTGAAEIHGIDWVQLGGIEDKRPARGDPSFLHRRNMFGSRSMTGFARDPWNQMLRIELAAGRGSCGVAPKAALCVCSFQCTPHRLFKV
jgi:hypothetical protein